MLAWGLELLSFLARGFGLCSPQRLELLSFVARKPSKASALSVLCSEGAVARLGFAL